MAKKHGENVKMWFVLLLMVVLGAAASRDPAFTTCARRLALLRYSVCYGLDLQKVDINLWSSEEEDYVTTKLPKRFAFRARRAATGWLSQQSRKLVEKCCRSPCDLDELVSYC